MSDGFWDLNAGEWFATVAIVIGAALAFWARRKNRKRRENLIKFPDSWAAERDFGRKTFTVNLTTELFLSTHSFAHIAHVNSGDTELEMEGKPAQPTSTTGRRSLGLSAKLDAVPENVQNVVATVRITLDDGTTRTSARRSISITDINKG